MVAGDLQSPIEGVLEVGGHIALDGTDANSAVLCASVQRQRVGRDEQGRGEHRGDDDGDDAALVDGLSRVGRACCGQRDQQSHPGAAEVGRSR